MIACVYGLSLVGKTTVAQRASVSLAMPLRSCGDAVRSVAKMMGTSIDGLSDDVHREIDSTTVGWALERMDCIVEGRFLDAVFASVDRNIVFFELVASMDSRVERGRTRYQDPTFSPAQLRITDAGDAVFRERLFKERKGTAQSMLIDTSGLSVDECALLVQKSIQEIRRKLGD